LAEGAVIVAPDVGAAKRASAVAERLGLPYAIVEKTRVSEKTGEAEARTLIGDVDGRRAIIVDDIIATGGTVIAAVELLLDQGAHEVYAAFSHGVFASDSLEKIECSPLKSVIVTNTIPPPKSPKITPISIGERFAKIIERIYRGESVSELFPHH
jgi:ribose-phosphate pyrophosphokinase